MPIYPGSETQEVDERYESNLTTDEINGTLGTAYRGHAVHFVYGMNLEDFGNRIPVPTYEVYSNGVIKPFRYVVGFKKDGAAESLTNWSANSSFSVFQDYQGIAYSDGIITSATGTPTHSGGDGGNGRVVWKKAYIDGSIIEQGVMTPRPGQQSLPAIEGGWSLFSSFAANNDPNIICARWAKGSKSWVSYLFRKNNADISAGLINFHEYAPERSQHLCVGDGFLYALRTISPGTPEQYAAIVKTPIEDPAGFSTTNIGDFGGDFHLSIDTSNDYISIAWDPLKKCIYTVSLSYNHGQQMVCQFTSDLEFVQHWPSFNIGSFGIGSFRGGLWWVGASYAVTPSVTKPRTYVFKLNDDGTNELIEFHDGNSVVDPDNSPKLMAGGVYVRWITDTLAVNNEEVWSFRQPDPEGVPLSTVVGDLCEMAGMTPADYDTTELEAIFVKGYEHKGVKSLREALEPLMQVYHFLPYEDDFKLKFALKNKPSVLTLTPDDLRARQAGSEFPDLVKIEQIEETRLPKKVSISYLNLTSNFEPDIQFAERIVTESVGVVDLKMPMVLEPSEAVKIADILLREAWTNRTQYSFSIPKKFSWISPATTVTLSFPEKIVNVMLLEVGMGVDGRLECVGVETDVALYTSTATTDETPVSPPITMPLGALVNHEVIDTNWLAGSLSEVPIYTAGNSVNWHGYQLQISRDSGATWSDIGGYNTGEAVIGTVQNTLDNPPFSGIFDDRDTLKINISTRSPDLESVTDLDVLSGRNVFAVGAPGRWELIGAASITQTGEQEFALSHLLRGMNGTEHNMGKMELYDSIVLIDADAIEEIGLNDDSIGAAVQFRALFPRGDGDPDNVVDVVITGESRKSWAPVHIQSWTRSTGDIELSWARRVYKNGGWRDSVDVPLYEAENYTIEIYSALDMSAPVRTVDNLTSSVYTYTSADKATDFPSGGDVVVRVYQINEITGKTRHGEHQL